MKYNIPNAWMWNSKAYTRTKWLYHCFVGFFFTKSVLSVRRLRDVSEFVTGDPAKNTEKCPLSARESVLFVHNIGVSALNGCPRGSTAHLFIGGNIRISPTEFVYDKEAHDCKSRKCLLIFTLPFVSLRKMIPYISGMDLDTVKPLYIDFNNRQRLKVSYWNHLR